MKLIRSLLDKQEQLFAKGSKLEKLYPLHEALDTILYTPGMVTKGTTHVREALDLKRMMIMVAVALMPCIGMAFYNTGYQANLAIGNGAEALDVWQTTVFAALGFACDGVVSAPSWPVRAHLQRSISRQAHFLPG